MFRKFSNSELRTICGENIENMEIWSRNIIDAKLSERYGNNETTEKVKILPILHRAY